MWKTHSSGLRVSSSGQVRGYEEIKINSKGYLVVKIITGEIRGNVHIGPGDRKTRRFYVHRLVALLFHGPSRGRHVNHKDGNKLNNRRSNLEWVTRARNAEHAHKTGLIDAKGEGNGRAVLTETLVRKIRRLDPGKIDGVKNPARRARAKRIAHKLGVSDVSIVNVWDRRTWCHVS
jgi:hypothetical protein